MKFSLKKKIAAAVAVTAVVVGGGAAYAVWTSPSGTGSGNATGYTATAGNVTSATTNGNSSDATDLYPGSSVTNTITVTNTNPYPVKVTSIADAGVGSDVVNTTCAAGTVTATSQSAAGGIAQSASGPVAIPAHSTGTYDVVYTMASTADNACQGQAFVVPLTIGSQSSAF
jgi:hypothetical protein